MSQLTFDFDALSAPAYQGAAPLHFTVDYFTPAELVEAHKAAHVGWEWGMRKVRTWDLGITTGWCNRVTPGHNCWLLQVDLRCTCKFWDDRRDFSVGPVGCFCVGDLLYQANCPDCRWHFIAASENEVVEAWHDHAWPGWRELPVVPFMNAERQMSKKGAAEQVRWIEANYPVEWQTPGAPIVTERSRMGTRHVAGRSPWGGFDLSASDRMRWFAPSGVVGA